MGLTTSHLHNLKVVGKHILRGCLVLGVVSVSGRVVQLEFLRRPGQHVINKHTERVIVKDEDFVANGGALEISSSLSKGAA